MLTRIALVASCLLSFLAANRSEAQTRLSVVSLRPAGETSDLGESREVTVVFSEPMVALGRIPNPVTAPFFKIQPAVAGTFRWSGTSILIFTPDPKVALPFSTRYTVTIDATATAISGRTLAAPYTVVLHHAHGEAAGDQLVPTRRSLRRADRARPAFQPAGPGGRPAAAADTGLQDPRLDAAGDVGRGPRPDAGDRAGGPRRLRSQGRRRHRGRELDGPRRRVLDRHLGRGKARKGGADAGRAADHDGAADGELDRAHRSRRDARRPGQRADAAAADLHDGARADVLRRRAAVPDPVRSRSLEPVAPASRGADGERPQGVLADRRQHRDGQAAGAQAGPSRRWRLGPQRGLHARGSRLRRAEAGQQVRAPARADAAGD